MIDTTLALAFNLPTLIILLALALLIFGSRLPTLGRDLGKSIKGFKKGLSETEEEEDEDDDEIEEPVKKKKKPKQLDSDETETQTVTKREKVAQAEEED